MIKNLDRSLSEIHMAHFFPMDCYETVLLAFAQMRIELSRHFNNAEECKAVSLALRRRLYVLHYLIAEQMQPTLSDTLNAILERIDLELSFFPETSNSTYAQYLLKELEVALQVQD